MLKLTLEKASPAYWPAIFLPIVPQELRSVSDEYEYALYHESKGQYRESLTSYIRSADLVWTKKNSNK